MVWDYLEEQGWVDFRVSKETFTEFFDRAQTLLPLDSEAGLAVMDLMHLNAAEAAIPQELLIPSPGAPFFVEVTEQAAQLAISATDCGPFVGHDPRERARLWDVTLYGGDASKLAWLSETDSVEGVAERFILTVTRLAELRHRAQSARRAWGTYDWPSLEAEPFAVRATLWRAKLAVLLREEEFADTLWEVYRSLSLGEPAGVAG